MRNSGSDGCEAGYFSPFRGQRISCQNRVMLRTVSAHLQFTLTGPSDLIFQIAVAAGTPIQSETLSFVADGRAYQAREIIDAHGARIHRFTGESGHYDVHYHAVVVGQRPVEISSETELVHYLRPSRYAESDALYSQARSLFGTLTGKQLVDAVSAWAYETLVYVPGSSKGTDSAVTTLAAGRGVCRDYSHIVVAMLRARDVPARVAAVYAPGLKPMDFHAVAEAWVDGAWHIIDATRLAPRSSLIRIATGRDASDIAFLTNHFGNLALTRVDVGAVSDILLGDDHISPVAIG